MNEQTATLSVMLLIWGTAIPVLPILTMYGIRIMVQVFLQVLGSEISCRYCDVVGIVIGHVWPLALSVWILTPAAKLG